MNKTILALRNFRILNNKNFFGNFKTSKKSLSLLNKQYRCFSTKNNNEIEPESHDDFKPKSNIKANTSEKEYIALVDLVNSFHLN